MDNAHFLFKNKSSFVMKYDLRDFYKAYISNFTIFFLFLLFFYFSLLLFLLLLI